VVATIAERLLSASVDAYKDHSAEAKLQDRKVEMFDAVRRAGGSHDAYLAMYAEVYVNAVTDYLRYKMGAYVHAVNSTVETYQNSRFCSSFNYLYRRYVEPSSYHPTHGFFLDHYTIPKNLDVEFRDTTNLNLQLFQERLVRIRNENLDKIADARKVVDDMARNLRFISQYASPKYRNYFEILIQRADTIHSMIFALDEADLIGYTKNKVEETIDYQFGNAEHDRQMKVAEADHTRYCPAIDKKTNIMTNEEVWNCYLPVAIDRKCSPAFAAYSSTGQ